MKRSGVLAVTLKDRTTLAAALICLRFSRAKSWKLEFGKV